MKRNNVNHPAHYNTGTIETIDIIKDKLTAEQFRGFCIGNIIKYVTRAEHKGGVEDYKKAKWYLDKLIEVKEGEEPDDTWYSTERLDNKSRSNRWQDDSWWSSPYTCSVDSIGQEGKRSSKK